MKKSLRKSINWLLVLGMVAGLLAAMLPVGNASAATLSWTSGYLPKTTTLVVNDNEKGPGNANGRNVIAVSPDYANDSRIWVALDDDAGGVSDEVAYSSNGGNTWTSKDPASGDTGDIVAIVPSPLYASDSTVFVASTTTVYRSTNGGSSYTQLGAAQGASTLVITSMAVAPNYDGTGEVIIGLADTASGVGACPTGTDGGDDCVRVWGRSNVLNWVTPSTSDMAADITQVAYSPSYSADGVILAVGSAGSTTGAATAGTYIYHVVGTGSDWNATFAAIAIDTGMKDIGITDGGSNSVIISSALAVPPDYDGSDSSKRVLWIGTNSTDSGSEDDDGVRRVTTSAGTLRYPGTSETPVSNIAISGTVAAPRILFTDATAALSNASYRTTNFTSNTTAPTITTDRPVPGAAATVTTSMVVALTPDGSTAFALGNSSANGDGGFSRSADGGNNFVQVSLYRNDQNTSAGTMVGLEVAPNYATSTHMIAGGTGAGSDLILYSENGGTNWTAGNAMTMTSNTYAFAYSPNFATDNTIYGADLGGNALKRSVNGGLSWTTRSSVACGSSTLSSVASSDENTVYVGCASGAFRKSVNGGFLFTSATGTDTDATGDIALSPAFSSDSTILIGNTGSVRISTNGGTSFTNLGSTTVPAGTNQVAFHPEYATNSTIFVGDGSVASATAAGIERWVVGTSTTWKNLNSAAFGTTDNVLDMGFGADGTLYVASDAAYAAGTDGGLWTSATPLASTASGVNLTQVGVTTSGTAYSGTATQFAHATVTSEQIWLGNASTGADAASFKHYTDTIANTLLPVLTASAAVVGSSNTAGTGVTGFNIGWAAVSGATGYQYQWSVDVDGDGTFFESGEVCTSSSASTRSFAEASVCDADGAGVLDAAGARPGGTTYNWRARVSTPVIGNYSAAQAITVALIAGASTGLPTLSQPNATNSKAATSSDVALQPLFVWTQVGGATAYELQVSTDGTFADATQIALDKTGTDKLGNQLAYQSAVNLNPGTVYFWRVRGVTDTSQGGWAPAAAFTTTSTGAASATAAATVLAGLEAAGNLELVTSFNYTSAVYESYAAGLPGNTLENISPNSVIIITVTADTTVTVSGIAFAIKADTPTPVPVGAAVTVTV